MRVRGQTKIKSCLRGPPLKYYCGYRGEGGGGGGSGGEGRGGGGSGGEGGGGAEVKTREEEGAEVDYELTHRFCSSVSSLTHAGKVSLKHALDLMLLKKTWRY